MKRIETAARVSIGRGVAFATLGVACLMAGLAGYPWIALKTGALAMMAVSAVLVLKAERAARVPHKRTEAWSLLAPGERPPEPLAQRLIAVARRECCLAYARGFTKAAYASFAAGFAGQALNAAQLI